MKPILFSTPMVQAILEGRKTQTRRIIKHQPTIDAQTGDWLYKSVLDGYEEVSPIEDWVKIKASNCPYGKIGDILWVRESWQLIGWNFEEGEMLIKYKTGETETCDMHDPDEDSSWLIDQVEQLENKGVIQVDPKNEERFCFTDKPQPWKPSIHMPKEACRLFLKIKSIRVSRIQEIGDDEICAEGLGKVKYSEAYGEFKKLWELINGKDSWNQNPWVWVIEFEQTQRPDNFL